MPFVFDIELTAANPIITYPPSVKNLPSNLPTASGSRYDLLFWGFKDENEERFYVIGGEGIATIPSGTADFQHLEWDNTGLKWDALDTITLQNATGIIKWKNAAGTEEATLSVTGIDNFLWTDFTTGAPHTMGFSGMRLDNIGSIRSGAIPNPSTGFIRLANTDDIVWRNAANTNNASFEFNAADKFEFTDLAGAGILATLDSTELDLQIGPTQIRMANNIAGSIVWRNALDTESLQLFVSGTNNLTIVDFTTGAPHDFFVGDMNIKAIGFLESGTTGVSGTGFVRMANAEIISWRNNAGTNDAQFEFNAADKFSFADLAGGGILATIDATELDLKVGSLLLTMGNNKAIQFRNAADTEFSALSLSGTNNFTWIDAPTGAPHDMFMGGLQIKNIGFLESGSIPTSTAGFIRMGNAEFVSWDLIGVGNGDISVNASDDFLFRLNGTQEFTISSTSVDFHDNNISWSTTGFVHDITVTTTSLSINTGVTTDTLFLQTGGGTRISLTSTGSTFFGDLDANTNDIVNMGGGTIFSLTTVTAVAGDFVMIRDATDSALKKVDANDFLGGGATNEIVQLDTRVRVTDTGVNGLIEFIADATPLANWNVSLGLEMLTNMDMNLNEIHFNDANSFIDLDAIDNGMAIHNQTTDQFNLKWAGALEYDFNETDFDLHNNGMLRMGPEIRFNASGGAIRWPIGTAPNETAIIGSTANLKFRTGATTDEFVFTQVTTDIVEFNSVEVRIINNDLELDVGQDIRWTASPGGEPRIGQVSGNLEYEVGVIDAHVFKMGTVSQLIMEEAGFQFESNLTNNPPKLILFFNRNAPADDSQIGRIDFTGKNSASNVVKYFDIFVKTDDDTSLFEDADIAFRIRTAGSFVELFRARGDSVTQAQMAWHGQTPITQPDYTITNPTTDRALNVTGDSLAQVAAVLGTVIQDLIDYGIYK